MVFWFAWLGLAIVTALAASARGRSPFGWLALGVLLGPLALIAALVMAPGNPSAGGGRTAEERQREVEMILGPTAVKPIMKACPFCFMEIDSRATICGHCRTPLEPHAD